MDRLQMWRAYFKDSSFMEGEVYSASVTNWEELKSKYPDGEVWLVEKFAYDFLKERYMFSYDIGAMDAQIAGAFNKSKCDELQSKLDIALKEIEELKRGR